MDLEVDEREVPVGTFSLDLLARDRNGRPVIIENQLGYDGPFWRTAGPAAYPFSARVPSMTIRKPSKDQPVDDRPPSCVQAGVRAQTCRTEELRVGRLGVALRMPLRAPVGPARLARRATAPRGGWGRDARPRSRPPTSSGAAAAPPSPRRCAGVAEVLRGYRHDSCGNTR